MDSRAISCFLDKTYVLENHIPLTSILRALLLVQLIDNQSLAFGPVTEHTITLFMTLAGHREEIIFHIITLAHNPIVLGLPWLQYHDPDINRQNRQLTFKSLCHGHNIHQ